MKHGQDLKRRLHTLETLSEAVSAMKSLAAHHFRKSREGLAAAHAYREGIEEVVAAMNFAPPVSTTSASATLLIASDLGLCDGYNTRLTQSAIQHVRQTGAQRLYCVGHRPANGLTQAGLTISRQYRAPSSIAGLTELLLELAQDLLEDYLDGRFDRLEFISARFAGVGEFTPVVTSVLPIEPAQKVPADPFALCQRKPSRSGDDPRIPLHSAVSDAARFPRLGTRGSAGGHAIRRGMAVLQSKSHAPQPAFAPPGGDHAGSPGNRQLGPARASGSSPLTGADSRQVAAASCGRGSTSAAGSRRYGTDSDLNSKRIGTSMISVGAT